ncbi:MAG TPA: S9 family peptidase, partial [Burkholderiaceae bacterium]|nr:S9 family peptidase [Burkholderiaceae bacterium]
MTSSTIATYGSWKSQISSDLIVADTVRLGQVRINGTDIYWTEGRPKEEGRDVLVRVVGGNQCTDVTGAPHSVRSRANEYGGGSFLVTRDWVFFCNNEDQRIYRINNDGSAQTFTTGSGLRYADAIIDTKRQRLIAVREDHRDTSHEAINTLVAIDLVTAQETVLQSGRDFYSSPRLSPDGGAL